MKEKLIARGAEAVIIKKNNKIIKKRVKKKYRIKEIDEKLRKLRTRAESRVLKKLEGEINVPKIYKTDENKKQIVMDFIKGKILSENLGKFDLKKQKEICKKIGKIIGKLHEKNIIHGDLTTSNMILNEDKIYLIDFGLYFYSKKKEDKAVDLHLFKQALESKHFQNWKKLYQNFISGYDSKEKKQVLNQLEKVEKRGRYKH